MGVDLLDDGHFRTYEGVDRDLGGLSDDLEFLNSTDRMLVSERFAREHGLKVGDSFQLVTGSGPQDFVVHALIREAGPVKAFGGSVASDGRGLGAGGLRTRPGAGPHRRGGGPGGGRGGGAGRACERRWAAASRWSARRAEGARWRRWCAASSWG